MDPPYSWFSFATIEGHTLNVHHSPQSTHCTFIMMLFFNYKSDIVPVLITSNTQLPKREWRSGLSKLNEKAEILSQCDFVESEEDQQSGLKYLGS